MYILDIVYLYSLTIVNKHVDPSHPNKARIGLVVMGYFLGLIISSSTMFLVSLVVKIQLLENAVFFLIMGTALISPYFIMYKIYFTNLRYIYIASKYDVSSFKKYVFTFYYVLAHIYFMIVLYLAGK